MNERILIIEDDQDIAFIEKDYLEMSGYAITIASDGLTGLKEGLSGSYQLVLLDVMLPGMDGFEVCRRLRDKVDIPIMMVTAKREDIDKIRGWDSAPMIMWKSPFHRAFSWHGSNPSWPSISA